MTILFVGQMLHTILHCYWNKIVYYKIGLPTINSFRSLRYLEPSFDYDYGNNGLYH